METTQSALLGERGKTWEKTFQNICKHLPNQSDLLMSCTEALERIQMQLSMARTQLREGPSSTEEDTFPGVERFICNSGGGDGCRLTSLIPRPREELGMYFPTTRETSHPCRRQHALVAAKEREHQVYKCILYRNDTCLKYSTFYKNINISTCVKTTFACFYITVLK